MITLSVISLNGGPSPSPLSASFDELGGTIGRADTNQLVLPDPDRAISRVHAQVVFRNGGYAVVDRGSNPILVNGQALGSGREMAIKAGDKVQIGGFVLEVRQQAAAAAGAASDDPFAGLLGPAAGARAPAAGGSPGLFDPLAAFGGGSSPAPAPAFAPPPAPAPSSLGGIPDDWNPFAPPPPSARPPAQDFAQSLGRGDAGQFGLDSGAAAPAPLIPDLHGSGGNANKDNSLDALFGLGASSGGDPLANSLLDAPMVAPNMAASADPMKSLGAVPLASSQTVQDDLSDLHRPFLPPPAVDRPAPAPAQPAARPPAAIPVGAVLSWDQPESEGRTVIRPMARPAQAAPAPAAIEPPASAASLDPMAAFGSAPADFDPLAGFGAAAPMAAPVAAAMASFAPEPVAAPAPPPVVAAPPAPAAWAPAPQPAPAPAAAPSYAPSAGNADTAALLAAFREGLNLPNLKLDALTPELMRLVGSLLHESASGTVDLLVARAALKREVRAEATMIVAQKNNPLKFSPSAEVALQHLLSPTMRGFMDPAPAMRDAYNDLRAHQFGFIAGMRAALAGVLDRFKPAELEGRLTQRSGLRSLLPGSKKAAMWEVFTEHYAQISTEAEDDFHSLFGKAFLKAYEEHIAQLQHKDPP
ncbi:type VI secretion system-associated FHA domain protein TagH [Xylophilus rhododendri]|uniref:Type VI secretion system-associated FHA domain protein TagH n=1 Tax=Xylophilus rhododendri TaxID=2697032 RepID=A0A857JCN8_9BURK|nr:type VI secretion system-associated FHA domain protein TagH [Xylophilus rhododendri]QHJ00974.1 type VI secretion system-associated FHA domain protein TagH [Xylophilus rhododendri]